MDGKYKVSYQISKGLYLDKRRATEKGTYPIKARVSQGKERKYYSIGLYVTKDDWQKIISSHTRGELKTIKDKANTELQKIVSFINQMKLLLDFGIP
jgi:Arm DNA-binding domain